ncbi:MAG TPA: DUF2207 domain-containing protein, partial [Pseudonocardiaceae bacterium]
MATRRARRVAVLLCRALLTLAGGPGAGAAAAAGAQVERVTVFDVVAEIRADGSVAVVETISYDFGAARDRHGIEREIDLREPYDEERDRVYTLSEVTAGSPSGAPADVTLLRDAASTTIRVGHPDRTVSGTQTYRISYVLSGLMNAFDHHDELYWEVTGTRWAVPVEAVSVRVEAPGDVSRLRCLAGEPDSAEPCASGVGSGTVALFGHGRLPVGSGVTVVVGVPTGVVQVPPPVYAETVHGPWSRPPGAAAITVAVLAVLLAGVGGGLLWWRRGRDRMFVGLTPGLTPAGSG